MPATMTIDRANYMYRTTTGKKDFFREMQKISEIEQHHLSSEFIYSSQYLFIKETRATTRINKRKKREREANTDMNLGQVNTFRQTFDNASVHTPHRHTHTRDESVAAKMVKRAERTGRSRECQGSIWHRIQYCT